MFLVGRQQRSEQWQQKATSGEAVHQQHELDVVVLRCDVEDRSHCPAGVVSWTNQSGLGSPLSAAHPLRSIRSAAYSVAHSNHVSLSV